jgi:CubicO group peptidase (beta-lactamase class C family)
MSGLLHPASGPRRSKAGRLCVAFLLCCVLGGAALAQASDVYPTETWREPSATDAPWSAERLRAADAVAASIGTDTYLVVHRGVLVHRYGDVARPRNVYSVRKSVLDVLIGMQVDRGAIDLDQTLADLGIDDRQGLTPVERSATVRQLLQSRSGVYHPAAYETRDARAERPYRGSHAPGTYWYYNNWDFNTLGAIFEQRAGKSVFEALRDDLAGPLQFEDFVVSRDTESVLELASRYPAYVMKLSARDLARVGLLMARGGQWRDRRLVSERWIAESTTPWSTVPSGWHGYGYLWWVPQKAWPFWTRSPGDVFFASGSGGQVLFVDRRRDLVIVHQVDGSRLFRRDVTLEALSALLQGILAASPER